jgi:Lon-like protease
MRRRGITVLLGALVTALLSIGVLATPVPYVMLVPGPTVDTLGEVDGKEIIQVTGGETSTSAGQLRLTTVGVQADVKLLPAIVSWFDDERAVVPAELVYPPGQSREEVEQRNAEDFRASQTSAEIAALRELGYPVEVTVQEVTPGGPAENALRVGDVITSLDGQEVTSVAKLLELVAARPAGSELTIGYIRDGAQATTTITSVELGGRPHIGVRVFQDQPHPFDLKIELDRIGGPSAGLMFALGIIDKLTAEDLTGGLVIAGTGTIDDVGRVGAIGGIPQKLIGAREAGAEVFLVPAANCAEAVRNSQPGLLLVKVATLQEALAALATLRAGGEPPTC